MGLIEMARRYPDLCVTIRLGDLLEANEQLARQIRREADESRARRDSDAGCLLIPKDRVAGMLGVDPSTLWRWENEYNYLHPVRIGRKVYYRQTEIQAIIDAHQEEHTHNQSK